jgi:hypothetical protein
VSFQIGCANVVIDDPGRVAVSINACNSLEDMSHEESVHPPLTIIPSYHRVLHQGELPPDDKALAPDTPPPLQQEASDPNGLLSTTLRSVSSVRSVFLNNKSKNTAKWDIVLLGEHLCYAVPRARLMSLRWAYGLRILVRSLDFV